MTSSSTTAAGPGGWSSTSKPNPDEIAPVWFSAPVFPTRKSVDRAVYRYLDGSEFDLKPGDVSMMPSGHDAWVVGKEPVVLVDWHGAGDYAKS
jgi:hypothetical protein